MQTFFTNNRGFSLIETIVSVGILMLTLSAIMGAIYTSSGASRQTENQITAYYLAQDAIEYIRYTRDNFFKDNSENFETLRVFVLKTGCDTDSCEIDTTNNNYRDAIKVCSTDCVLHFNEGQALYRPNYPTIANVGSASPFSRYVDFEIGYDSDSDANFLKIDVTVSWDGSDEGEVVVTDYLYNWNQN